MPVSLATLSIGCVFATYGLVSFEPHLAKTGASYLSTFAPLWLFTFLLYTVYWVILWPKVLSPLKSMPGPDGNSWWNGQAHRLFTEGHGYPMSDWLRKTPHNGMFKYLGPLNGERIVVTSPEAIQEVIFRTSDFPRSPQAEAIAGEVLGKGVILVEGEEHKRQRKQLLPYFGNKYVRELCPTFWNKTKEATRLMTAIIEGRSTGSSQDTEINADGSICLEVGDFASRTALDVIALAALGINFNAVAQPHSDLIDDYHMVFAPQRAFQAFALMKTVLPRAFVHNLPFKIMRDTLKAIGNIKSACRESVRERKRQIANKESPGKDIMSLYLAGDDVPEHTAVDQMMTLLAAGHETVSVAVTWTFYMLCKMPEWQTRMREEVRGVVPTPDGDGQITMADIDRMPLLNAFINEVLRYWPPIPITVRQAADNTTIQGTYVPKGTKVALAIVATNRDSKMWGEDSYKFRPDRWLTQEDSFDANGGKSNKYGFMSFNHGSRMCIGQGFARTEVAFIVAAWIGRFEFAYKDEKMGDESKLAISAGGFSARPVDGLWAKMRVVPGW